MERKPNDLWQGGPWEQSSHPVLSPLHIPEPQKPILRRRKRSFSLAVPVLSILLILMTAAVVVLSHEAGYWGAPRYGFEFTPPDGFYAETEPDYNKPPSIPDADPNPELTVAFQPAGDRELSYEEIYNLCAPSMVSITALGLQSGTGTGIVLSEDGYILTNAHVVADCMKVEVVTFDNRTATAALVGFDSAEDLAVLKIELDNLTPARFGNSHDLHIGERVAALGDSLGYRSTITDGIISALDRSVDMDNVSMTLIQTSAAINFGNSGGALINRFGQVVGITTMKIIAGDGSTESMGFAIPSARVKYVADRLLAGENIVPSALGITINTLPVAGGGLEILAVSPGSDAAAKGLLEGDVLLSANGEKLTAMEVLVRLKTTLGAGDIVTFTVRRGEEIFDLEIALVPTADLKEAP